MKNLTKIFTIAVLFAALFPSFGGIKGGFSQNIGINQPNPDNSAVLDLTSTELGLLIPRMTTAQRDAINVSGSPNSVMIFNTTTKCFEFYYDGSWYELGCATETFTCGTSFTDTRDGQVYNSVQIGSQCWMAENLNYDQSAFGNDWCYDGDCTTYDSTYGRLYDWAAAMQGAASSNSNPSEVQGVCPSGWHLPSDNEWCELENTVEADTDPDCNLTGGRGTNTGGDMKETGTTNWDAPNTGATNLSGFTGLPGGWGTTPGSPVNIGITGYWWSTTENGSEAWYRRLDYSSATSIRFDPQKTEGFSVRCLKD